MQPFTYNRPHHAKKTDKHLWLFLRVYCKVSTYSPFSTRGIQPMHYQNATSPRFIIITIQIETMYHYIKRTETNKRKFMVLESAVGQRSLLPWKLYISLSMVGLWPDGKRGKRPGDGRAMQRSHDSGQGGHIGGTKLPHIVSCQVSVSHTQKVKVSSRKNWVSNERAPLTKIEPNVAKKLFIFLILFSYFLVCSNARAGYMVHIFSHTCAYSNGDRERR